MRTRRPWACVLLLLTMLGGAALQGRQDSGPAYTIKIKTYPDEGQGILCRETDKQESMIRLTDKDGKKLKEDRPTEENEEVFLLTVVEGGDKVPRRYRQDFRTATSSTVKNKVRSYQGAAIDYVLRGRQFRLELPEKPEISADDQQYLLARAYNSLNAPMDEVFIPSKAVKVGESWKVDPRILHRGFGQMGKFDPQRTEGTACLTKVYEKDGQRFGVIEINLSVVFTSMANMEFDPPALFTIKGTLDTDITGRSPVGLLKLTTQLKGHGKIDQKGVKITLEILREGTTRNERSLPR